MTSSASPSTPPRSNANRNRNRSGIRNENTLLAGISSSGQNHTDASIAFTPQSGVLSGSAGATTPSIVLRQLSFEAMASTSISSPSARRTRSSSSNRKQQGVLWKRRDVFRNRWRPRWFVLHPHQGVLTYYLMTNSNEHTSGDAGSIRDDVAETDTDDNNRRRTWSESSNYSENSVDYDVVPRGTIYLMGGCSVQPNDALTRPEENLYAFTIVSPTGRSAASAPSSRCHLAARTAESRARWIRRIAAVCGEGNGNEGDSSMTEESSLETQLNQTAFPLTEEPASQAASVHPPTSKWARLDGSSCKSSSVVTENVPADLASKIDELLDQYLPLCDMDSHDANSGWTKLNDMDDNEVGVSTAPTDSRNLVGSWIRQDPVDGLQMIKTSAVLHGHHLRTVFSLLVDSSNRPLYETNIQSEERLQVYNPHVFADYFAYHPVWPTSAREFAVIVHWQVVRKKMPIDDAEEERAIVLLGFSCDDSNQLKPSKASHVRGALKISMSLLQPFHDGTSTSCILTRILSYDLCGNIPRRLTNTIMIQQAKLPMVIDVYLKRQAEHTEPAAVLTGGQTTNRDLVRDIVQPVLDSTRPRRGRRISFDDEDVRGLSSNDMACKPDDSVEPMGTKVAETRPSRHSTSASVLNNDSIARSSPARPRTLCDYRPPVAIVSLGLLAPAILYSFSESWICSRTAIFAPYKELIFVITTWFAIRYAVLLHLGPSFTVASLAATYPHSDSERLIASMTCRFSIDLKGVLRFIANKKEDREEEQSLQGKDISVTHIVICAMARALGKLQKQQKASGGNNAWLLPSRRKHHVSMRWLWIDGVYCLNPVNASGNTEEEDGIDISIVSTSPSAAPLMTICQAGRKYRSVQEIANVLSRDEIHASTLGHAIQESRMSWWMQILSQHLPLFSILCASVDQRPRKQARNGQCLVITTPDSSGHHGEIDIDVVTKPNFQIVVVLSGVRLLESDQMHNKRPTLSMSMTIQNVPLTHVHECRQLAQDIQRFLQFPELVDDEQYCSQI